MVRCCVRNTGFVVVELTKLTSLGFNQSVFMRSCRARAPVRTATACFDHFFDMRKVLAYQQAELDQIPIPGGRMCLALAGSVDGSLAAPCLRGVPSK